MAVNPYDEIVAGMDPEPAAADPVADPAPTSEPVADLAPEPADPDANPYDEIVAEQGAEDEAIRRVHAEGTAKIDRKAEVLRLAERTGHDPGLVDRNFDKLTASLAAADFDMERWRRETPASLVAMFRDRPALGAVARGDEKISPVLRLLRAGSALRSGSKEGLDALPFYLRASPAAPVALFAGAWEAVASGAVAEAFAVKEVPLLTDARTEEGRAAGVLGRVRMTFEDKLAADEVATLNTAKLFAGLRGEDTSDIDAQIADRNAIAGTRDYGQGEVEQLFLDAADVAGSLYSQAKGAGVGGAAAATVAGLGTLAVTKNAGLARAAAGEALGLGAKAGSTVASFSLETGGMYGEMPYYTDEGEPIPEEIRAGASILYGITSSAVEGMSYGAAEKAAGGLGRAILSKGGRAEILKQMKSAEFRAMAGQIGRAFAEHGGTEGLEEYGQEWLGGLSDFYARSRAAGSLQTLDTEAIHARALDAGGKALGGSLVMGLGGAALSTSANGLWALRARQDGSTRSAESAAAIVSLAGGPMAKASPGSVAELVARESAASGEAVTSFWVAPEELQRFFQDGKADPSILGPNGAAQMREALATGGKVEVPVAVYLDGIAKVEGAEALTEHLATRPGYLTGAELKAAQEGLEEEAQALAKQIEAEDTAPASEAEARLVAGIEEQIRAAGRPAGEAKKAAAFYRAFARTQAARFNMDADALFDGYSLRIERGDGTATSTAQRQDANPAASRALADLFHKQDPTAREQAMFIDTTTGALNARAWKRIEKSAKSAAVISIEGVKFRNDKAGHEAGNDVFRAAAQAIARLRPDVAKVGGDFAIADLDQDALGKLLEEANKDPALQGFRLVGMVGKDRLAAMAANNKIKGDAETAGTRAKRGFKPLAALGDPTAGKVAGTPISEALRAALGEIKNPGEVFSEIYTEAETGLLTKDGFDAIRANGKAKAFTASLDLNGLKEFNVVLGEDVGDALIERFGNALRELGGADFDAAHISGDEYMAQSDDEAALNAFVERARAAVEDARIEIEIDHDLVRGWLDAAKSAETPPDPELVAAVERIAALPGDAEIVGLLFGGGVGKNVDEAEAALNADKDRLEREGRRGDGAAAKRVVERPSGSPGSGAREGDQSQARDLGRRADLAEVGRQRYLAPEALEQRGIPQTETPEFREWFKKSQVVKRDGSPRVVFHGSKRGFNVFKGDDAGLSYFAFDREISEHYGPKVREFFLRVENPLDLGSDAFDASGLVDALRSADATPLADRVEAEAKPDEYGVRRGVFRFLRDPKIVAALTGAGYDGFILADDHAEGVQPRVLAVPAGSQIKSATGNRGTFDPNDPNILRQDEAPGPAWYSAAARAVTAAKQDKNSSAAWLALISKTPGVRKEEIDFLGLADWLGKQKGSVTREQVAEFINAHALVIEQVEPEGGVSEELRRNVEEAYEEAEGQWLPDSRDSSVNISPADFDTEEQYQAAVDKAQRRDEEAISEEQADADAAEALARDAMKAFHSGDMEAADEKAARAAKLESRHGDDRVWGRFHVAMMAAAERGSSNSYADYALGGEKPGTYKEILFRAPGTPADAFESQHFGDSGKGLLAHARVDERDVDGAPAFFVQEMQSDLHQQGRDAGYETPATPELQKLRADYRAAQEENERLRLQRDPRASPDDLERARAELNRLGDLILEAPANEGGVPNAPLKSSWDEMIAKAMIRRAIEGGHKTIAWAAGQQNVDVYPGLENVLDALRYQKREDGSYYLTGSKKDTGAAVDIGTFKEEKLAGAVGKDVAKRIVAGEGKLYDNTAGVSTMMIEGDDLKTGGHGMLYFYDTRVPGIMRDLLKKFGGKVTKGKTTATHDAIWKRRLEELQAQREDRPDDAALLAEIDAMQSHEGRVATVEVWKADLPQALIDTVLREGMPLFQGEGAAQDGATAPRGWMERLGKLTRIFLSKKADASTAIHEGAHFFLNMQGDLAARADAPQQIRDDRAATLRFLGIEEGKVPREAHEKFARAVEAYVREGKAPSVELAGVFAALRRFLLKVYESVAGLNVELNDEIREVFDRMLATDAEIARARGAVGQGRGLTREQMGVPAEEFAAYESDRTRAADEAGRAVAVELAKEHKREADAWWKKERKAHEARALWEHRFLPAERAIRLLDGELVVDDGSTVKVAVKPTAAEVAEMIGYASVDAMREAINAHPAEDVWAAAKASERMKERHPGILEDRKRLKNLIAGQFHNEHTLQHLLRERAALWARAGGKPPRIETMKRAVEILAERKRVKDLKPHARLVAERSQAERKFRAAAMGDFATAGDASQKQILNLLGWRAERDLSERLEKAEAAIGKRDTDSYRAGLGRASPALLALHDGILAATGFADGSPDADAVGALLEAAELVADEGGFAFDVEALRLLLQKPKPWKELTTAEAFNVADAVKNIRAFANARNEITLAGEKAKIEEHVAKIKVEAAALRPDLGKGSAEGAQKGNAKRALERVLGAHGEMLDPEIIFESLGPTMGAIFQRYRDAKTEKYELTREVLSPLVKRLESLPKEIADTRFDVIPELDQDLPIPPDVDLGGPRSRMHLLMVLLNFGNESNKERLLGGYGWTEQQVTDALVKHIPKPWWDLAQEIWDLNDKALWPKLAAKEQRKTGLEPGKIGATAISTPHGVYSGGYFPAKYSKRGSRGDVAERQAEAAAEKIRSSAYVRASTLKSHTKKRADHYENVINLEWSVFPSHVAQVIHDIAFDEMIRDAGRIILHPEVKQVINHRLGERRAAEPLEWLKAVANAQSGSSANRASEVAAVMGAFKSRMVVGAIGLNAATAAGDFANSLVAMGLGTEQGGVSARYGVPAYLAALPGAGWATGVRKMALSKSPELRNRMEAKRDDHRKMFLSNFGKNRGRLTRAQEAVANTAWFFLEQTEKMASTQVWLARYWQEKANGTDEAAAILAADKSVTAVLVSPERVELPALVRDPGSIGSQLVFFGYFAKLYGITVGRLGGAALGAATKAARSGTVGGYAAGGLKVAELAGRAMAVHFFASVVGEVLSGRGPEDEEEPEEYLLRKMLTSPLQMIPMFGGFLEAGVASAIRGHLVAPSARAAPALSLAEGVVRKIGKMVSDEAEDDDRVWAAIQTALLVAKWPANAPVRAGKYLTDLALGDTEAETPFDVASGVGYGQREGQPSNPASLLSDAIQ